MRDAVLWPYCACCCSGLSLCILTPHAFVLFSGVALTTDMLKIKCCKPPLCYYTRACFSACVRVDCSLCCVLTFTRRALTDKQFTLFVVLVA